MKKKVYLCAGVVLCLVLIVFTIMFLNGKTDEKEVDDNKMGVQNQLDGGSSTEWDSEESQPEETLNNSKEDEQTDNKKSQVNQIGSESTNSQDSQGGSESTDIPESTGNENTSDNPDDLKGNGKEDGTPQPNNETGWGPIS